MTERQDNKKDYKDMPTKECVRRIRGALAQGWICDCVRELVEEVVNRVEVLSAAMNPILDIDLSALEMYPLDEEDDIQDTTIYSPRDNGLYDENSFTKEAQVAIMRCPNAIRLAKDIYKKGTNK